MVPDLMKITGCYISHLGIKHYCSLVFFINREVIVIQASRNSQSLKRNNLDTYLTMAAREVMVFQVYYKINSSIKFIVIK